MDHKFTCSTCKVPLTKENGYFSKNGLASHYCKQHHKEKAKKWRLKNKSKTQDYRFRNLYGITLEEYGRMFETQNAGCAICGEVRDKSKMLCVDHCHKTGKVRGLLCEKHNWLLGNANDSIQILESAIKYLKERN